jgi:hypothetical protein
VGVVLLFFLFCHPRLDAQRASQRVSRFLVVPLITIETVTPELDDIVGGNVDLELQRAGLEVVQDGNKRRSREDVDSVVDRGRKMDADYVVSFSYTISEGTLALGLACVDVAQEQVVSRSAVRGGLDLEVDRLIAEAVDLLLQPLADSLRYSSGTQETKPDREPRQREPIEIAEIVQAPLPKVLAVSRPIEFALGMAPFFPVGEASNLFGAGYMMTTGIAWRLAKQAGHIRLGFVTSALIYRAEAPGVSAGNLLVPFGLEASYRSGLSPGFFVRASGGGALLAVDPNDTGYLTKLVPYVSSGVGVELLPTDSFGMAFDVSYYVFIEQQTPIMGYAPTIGAFLRR